MLLQGINFFFLLDDEAVQGFLLPIARFPSPIYCARCCLDFFFKSGFHQEEHHVLCWALGYGPRYRVYLTSSGRKIYFISLADFLCILGLGIDTVGMCIELSNSSLESFHFLVSRSFRSCFFRPQCLVSALVRILRFFLPSAIAKDGVFLLKALRFTLASFLYFQFY